MNSRNIEDVFKDSFEGQEMQPSKRVWTGINRKLWKYQLGGFFKGRFSDFNLEPAPALWSSISRKLWWALFLRFSLTRFNIYYSGAAAVLLTFIGITIFSGQNSDTNKKSVNNKGPSKTEATQIAQVVPRNTDPVEDTDQTKPKAEKVSTEIINFLNTKKGDSQENQPAYKKNKENKTKDKKLKANNVAPVFFRNNEEKNNNANEAQALITYNNQSQNSDSPDLRNKDDLKYPLAFLDSKKPLITTDPFNRQYPDTIGYSVLGTPIVFVKSAWAAELYFSPLYNQSILKSLNSEFNNTVDLRESLTYPDFSYSLGANLNYYRKNWLFQVGIAYSELSEKVKKPTQIKDVFTFDFYQYFDNGFYVNDTVWFLDMDSLLQNGDSIWVPGIINQTWQEHRDSLLQKGYDTITNTKYNNVRNKYTYFEIPVMLGFELKQNKFSFAFKGGIATGFFQNVRGTTVHQDGQSFILLEKDKQPFNNIMFSMLLSFNIGLDLSNKFTIFGEPYFRKNLNSVFENKYYMSHKFQSAGIKFGVKYRF